MSDDARSPLRMGGADGAPFEIVVDGERMEAYPGETVGTAILATGRRALRQTTRRDEPRGLYCVMGVCWECVVLLDGRSVRACMTAAAPGMRVQTRWEGAAAVRPAREASETQ